jgi:hypothetical protein
MLSSFGPVAFVSSIRDRFGGGGLKKLSSVRGRFAVAMLCLGFSWISKYGYVYDETMFNRLLCGSSVWTRSNARILPPLKRVSVSMTSEIE